MTSWAARERAKDLTWQHDRLLAMQVPCDEPGCGAAAEELCRNVRTGDPLEHQAAHKRRIDAGKAAEVVDVSGPESEGRPAS
jgi:hypothetical protein